MQSKGREKRRPMAGQKLTDSPTMFMPASQPEWAHRGLTGMNRSFGAALAVAAAATALSACHVPGLGGKAKAPTGQVVADVGDREITMRDLRAEAPTLNTTDVNVRHQADQATLRNMVGRTILAKAARDQGLDKTPDFEMSRKRMED